MSKSKYSQRSEEERQAEREAYYEEKEVKAEYKRLKKENNQSLWKNHPHINTLKKFAKANS